MTRKSLKLSTREARQWRTIPDWESYEVSDDGEVRRIGSDKNKSQYLNTDGYAITTLFPPHTPMRVHRLVAMAFCQNTDPLHRVVVGHKDNDITNNCASNLEWCTQAENLAHMTRCGRRSRHNLGKRPANAKLSDDQVTKVRSLRSGGECYRRIGEIVGCSKRTAIRICHGTYYKARRS